MLDRLFDFIVEFARFFRFWVVIQQFECAVVMRLGRFRKELPVGLSFLAPFGIDTVFADNKVASVKPLEAQTITLKDGKTAVVKGIITMEVEDPVLYFLAVENVEGALLDSSAGVIADVAMDGDWEGLSSGSVLKEIERRVKRNAKKWGILVTRVQLSDISLAKAHKLYVDNSNTYKSNGYEA